MDSHTLEVLEYRKVLGLIGRYLTTDVGRERLEALAPEDNLEVITRQHRMISEVRLLLDWGHAIPLSPLRDVRGPISRAVSGAILEAASLLEVGKLARVSRLIRAFFSKHRADLPLLWSRVSAMGDVREVETEIDRSIDEDTNIRDRASPALKRIRSEKAKLSSRITSMLDDILSSGSLSRHLQDRIITIRNGRYVIPVKAEARSKVAGIVHDTSQSGATVFIEPMKTVDLNNMLRTLELEEKDEIGRILKSLSEKVAGCSEKLGNNLNIIAEIDLLLASARFAREFACSEPVLVSNARLKLKGARHPILIDMKRSGQLEEVVPLDLEVRRRGVLITGPNAGGKTVALKTIGLAVLLAQSGLHVPCEDGTEIGLFSKVYADIGDEQSIELSLSTFSSHMSNIVRILAEADVDSLVLLDEIAAGTDPAEGAALARTIIEDLLSKKATIIATTHHGDLKVFAYEHPELENASMEFDGETLSPTYRLIEGIPGASHALQIARRLGMPDTLLERARQFIGGERTRFEELSRELISRIQAVSREKATIEAKQQQIESLISEYESRLETVRSKEKEIRKQALREARDVVEDARRKVSRLVRELKQKQPPPHEAKRIETRIREESARLAEEIQALEATGKLIPLKQIEPGRRAHIGPLGTDGIITGEPEGGKVEVAVGGLRIRVSSSHLYEPQTEETKLSSGGFEFEIKAVPNEIDVRGMTAEDAWERVDRYLDDAALYGYDWARVVHGKGRGILARKIHEMLATHPAVQSYRFGEISEGGTGVTIVELRRG